jgi:cobalt/nickel transport protein
MTVAAYRKLWVGLLILALLTPLGILLPQWLGAGSAWGEWGAEELRGLVGYVPAQLARLGNLWHAPLPDYASPGAEGASTAAQSAWYIVSALVGAGAVAGLALLLGRWIAHKERSDEPDTGVAD